MNLNGQEYESCYLTPKEKAVVDAMRAGARVYMCRVRHLIPLKTMQ